MKALIMVSGLGIIALLGEIFKFKKALLPLVILGLIATFVVNLLDWDTSVSYFNNMMVYDNYALLFTAILLIIATLWFLLAPSYFKEESNMVDHFALVLFALAGGVVLTSYSHLAMLFIGIEILSIPMYVLASSRKNDLRSNEAGLKYFLMGAFATGFLLFGITLIYGASHSFHLSQISAYVAANGSNLPVMFQGGIMLILIGLAFKVSIFPFHFWAPDVYEGSPTVVTALMATIVKVAALAAFYRLFSTCFAAVPDMWVNVLWVMAAATILVGNLTALFQKDLKRMLAYSSVSHAGYILFAIIAMNDLSASALMYYALAYSVSTLAAFGVLVIITEQLGDTSIESLRGFAKNNPFLAVAMIVAMFSLAGIPPLAGFFAKYYLFAAALQNGQVALVLIAVLGSVISVYYYFRVVVAMFNTDREVQHFAIAGTHKVLLALTLIATLVLGIFPGLVTNLR